MRPFEVDTTTTSQSIAGSVTLEPGSPSVGPCVKMNNGVSLNANDFAVGWVVVTDS